MNSLKLEREKYEELCKESIMHLQLKDEVINDLKSQLEDERTENTGLKEKIKNYEFKLNQIDENLFFDDDFNEKLNKSKSVKNSQNFHENSKKSEEINIRSLLEENKELFEENSALRQQVNNLEQEINNLKIKNCKISEIESIYKTQNEANRLKIDEIESLLNSARDREKYFEELISRYKNMEKEYEIALYNKEVELNQQNNTVHSLNENIVNLNTQINDLVQNNSNIAQDLLKEIRSLEEKNKTLEMKLFKSEFQYQEEIKLLHKSLQEDNDNQMKMTQIKADNPVSASCGNMKSSQPLSELKFDELTGSISKNIKEKIKEQNVKISTQTIEISNLNYENERLQIELNQEKEMNQKLQLSIAEYKYKSTYNKINQKTQIEDAAVQTIIRSDEIEDLKKRVKILGNDNNNFSDLLENKEKEIKNLLEKITFLERENFKSSNEVKTLMKKLEKGKKIQNLDHDLVYNISNISKLNATVSYLKARENELIDKLNYYESFINENKQNQIKDQGDKNQENKIPNNYNNSNKFHLSNFNLTNSNLVKSKDEGSVIVSFNVSEDSVENNRGLSQSKQYNLMNNELEIKRLGEDNMYLKEQNFNYINELQRLQDNVNYLKLQINEKNDQIQELLRGKERLEKHIQGLEYELNKSKGLNCNTIEEFKGKLMNFSELNDNLSSQFQQLQQNFMHQEMIIQEKDYKINEMIKELQSLQNDKENLIDYNHSLKNDFEVIIHEKNQILSNLERMEMNLSSKQNIYENELRDLNSKNSEMRDKNNKFQLKIKELFEMLKKKDKELLEINSKLNAPNEFTKSMTDKYIQEINKLRSENDELLRKKTALKLENNELKYENSSLKERSQSSTNLLDSKINPSRLSNSFESNSIQGNSLNRIQKNLKFNYKKANLNSEEFDLKRRNDELISQLNEAENHIRNIEMELENSEIDKQRLIRNIVKLENEVESFSQDKSKLIDQNNFLELQTIKNRSESLIHDKEKKENDTKNALKDLEVKLIEKSNENNEISKKIQDITIENEKLKDNIETLNNETKKINEDFSLQIDQIKLENENLKQEISILNNMLESKQSEHEEKLNQLQSELSNEIQLNSKLRLELEEKLLKITQNYDYFSGLIKKNENKLEKLVQLYESHIEFLRQRFQVYISELLTALNYKKEGRENYEKLIKHTENLSSLINDISQREAAIDSFKKETKSQKSLIKNLNHTNKKLLIENENLKEQLNIKILQKKIQTKTQFIENSYNFNEILEKFNNLSEILNENSNARLSEQKLMINIQRSKVEIRMLKEKIDSTKNENYDQSNELALKINELKEKENKINELNKLYKNDIIKLTEEITRIKEKWVTPEKWSETLDIINSLEKTIRTQKEEINRKKELIQNLKNDDISKTTKEKLKSMDENEINNLNDKLKSLSKELARRENYIKELKTSNELFKEKDKKYVDEIANLTEKLKIAKIDINRKEDLLKNTKDKLNSAFDDKDSKNKSFSQEELEKLKENLKRLKLDNDRKDNLVKSYKIKIEGLNSELEQLKQLNNKLTKTSINEIDKELKLQDLTKTKLDQFNNYSDSLLTIVKRIFKDMIVHYESLNKINKTNSNPHELYNDGIQILNISPNDISQYLTPHDKTLDYFSSISKSLDKGDFNVSQILECFFTLKEKIIGFYKNSTLEKSNEHGMTNNKYENFLSKIKDNTKSDLVLKEFEGVMKNLKLINE